MESLLTVVEDAADDWEKAAAVERRVIEELRQMDNEALTAWAERGVEKSIVVAQAEPDWRPGGKKTPLAHDLWSNRGGGTVVADRYGAIERPFSALAEISCRGSSLPLQRVMTDFGANAAFGRVPDKLQGTLRD